MSRSSTVTPIRSRHETAPLAEASERLREDANPREIAKLAAAMTPEMLRCRRLRAHKWEPSYASKVRGGWDEELVCERCTATKTRHYNSKGKVTEYGPTIYAEGYLFKGVGRLGERGREVINLASLNADAQVIDLTRAN